MGNTVILRNTKCAIVEETTEGTLATETDVCAVLPRDEAIEINIGREFNEEGFLTGSFTKSAGTAGMWDDGVGWTYKTYARGVGTLTTRPDFGYALKNIMGAENINTNDTVAATTPKTGSFTAGSGSNDLTEGQLIMHEDGDIVRVTDIATELISVWPPFPATPVSTDVIYAGQNYMLASSGHTTLSSFLHLTGPKRFTFAGGRVNQLDVTFEVGQSVMMDFTIAALTPAYDHTAQSVTPVVDTETEPPVCLGIDADIMFSAIASGTPTTTETIITAAADFDVTANVDYISIDVGTDEWETVLITNVSGNPGAAITLTHAAVSVAASATDTVYVTRKNCAEKGASVSISITMEQEFKQCMGESSGKSGSVFTGRMVTINATPYFDDLGPLLRRDDVVGASMTMKVGSTVGNIFACHIPNLITKTVGISLANLSTLDVESQAVRDSTLGNDHEIVFATF